MSISRPLIPFQKQLYIGIVKRTNPDTEQLILRRIAQGFVYTDISTETGVSVSCIKKIKQRNKSRLTTVNQQLIKEHVAEVSEMLRQSRRLISRFLKKADEGLADISLRDLLQVSKEMHRQSLLDDANKTPVAYDLQESARRGYALAQAITNEDDEALAKLLFPK